MTPALTWTTGHVDAGGEAIYYEAAAPEAPSGTVVLGHGGAGSHALWFQQVPVLAQRRRVVTWDVRGFGGSTLRSGQLDASIAAADLHELLEALGVEQPVDLIAQSMGGWPITAFALRWPDRVRSLIYTSTTGGLFTTALDDHFTAALARVGAPPPVLGRHALLAERLAVERPELAFLYQQMGTLQPPPPAAAGAMTRERFALEDLRACSLPTLFIIGNDDPFFPPRLVQDVAEQVGGRVSIIAGAGHSPFFEAADAWNDAVIAFLGDQEPAGHT